MKQEFLMKNWMLSKFLNLITEEKSEQLMKIILLNSRTKLVDSQYFILGIYFDINHDDSHLPIGKINLQRGI